MKKHKVIYIVMLIAMSILCLQCRSKRLSLGYNDRIYVLADSSLWAEMESLLRETFEKPLVTPQHETVFTLVKANLDFFKSYNNLLFLTSLDEKGAVSEFIKKSFHSDLIEKVTQGDYLFIKKMNGQTANT